MSSKSCLTRFVLVILVLQLGSAPAQAAGPALTALAISAGYVGQQLASWVIGKGLDEVATRSGLAKATRELADDLLGASTKQGLPKELQQELQRLSKEYQRYALLLDQNSLSDADVRQQVLSLHHDYQGLRRHLAQLESRIDELERRFGGFEERTKRLEDQAEETARRFSELEQRLDALENADRSDRGPRDNSREGKPITVKPGNEPSAPPGSSYIVMFSAEDPEDAACSALLSALRDRRHNQAVPAGQRDFIYNGYATHTGGFVVSFEVNNRLILCRIASP